MCVVLAPTVWAELVLEQALVRMRETSKEMSWLKVAVISKVKFSKLDGNIRFH